jgi:hypothetical protein
MSCAVSGRLQLGDVGINVRRGQAVGSSAWGLARPQDPDARTHRRWRRANHWLRQRAALLPESDIRILLSTAGSQRLFQNVVRLEDEWVLKSGTCDHRRPGLRLQHRDAGPREDPRPSEPARTALRRNRRSWLPQLLLHGLGHGRGRCHRGRRSCRLMDTQFSTWRAFACSGSIEGSGRRIRWRNGNS